MFSKKNFRRKKVLILLLIFMGISGLYFVLNNRYKAGQNTQTNPLNSVTPTSLITQSILPSNETSVTLREKVTVEKVVDGDTIELIDGRRVRLLGIDTPELHKESISDCFATNAAEINRQLVEGQTIEMEADVTDKDNYNRLLRYIWVDDVFVNDFLLRQGFAKLFIIPPDYRFKVQFNEAETD